MWFEEGRHGWEDHWNGSTKVINSTILEGITLAVILTLMSLYDLNSFYVNQSYPHCISHLNYFVDQWKSISNPFKILHTQNTACFTAITVIVMFNASCVC